MTPYCSLLIYNRYEILINNYFSLNFVMREIKSQRKLAHLLAGPLVNCTVIAENMTILWRLDGSK